MLATALVCLAFQLRLPGTNVDDADYQALATVLETEARPGDVVLLWPWWTERARRFVPLHVPVVGYQGSDGDDLLEHPRIWVVRQPSLPGSNPGAFAKAFNADRVEEGPARSFGNLELQPYRNGRHRPVVFSATRSPGVAPEWHEVKFSPQRCVRLNPPGGPARASVEFANVPASTALRLEAGYTWDRGAFHSPGLSTTHVGVDVGGQTALTLDLAPGREGLLVASGPGTAAGATLQLWAQADNHELRDICVKLFALGTTP